MLWQAAKPITKINIEQFNIGKADNSKLNIAEGIASGMVSLHRRKPIQSYLLYLSF